MCMVLCLHVCLYIMHMSGAYRGQKRAMDLLQLELHDCELSCGCWESNPGSLQKQSVLLTSEPRLLLVFIYQLIAGLALNSSTSPSQCLYYGHSRKKEECVR